MSKQSRRGFTLIELLIALVVAGVLGVMFMQLYSVTLLRVREPEAAIRSSTSLDQVMAAMSAYYEAHMVAWRVDSGSALTGLQVLQDVKTKIDTPNYFGTGYQVMNSSIGAFGVLTQALSVTIKSNASGETLSNLFTIHYK